MCPHFFDLSMPISASIVTDPPPLRPKIHYSGHKDGVAQMLPFFPGLREDQLPDGEAWAVEELELSTHSGSHMDAPWHYHSTTLNGELRSPTIDEAPLDLFLRPGVKLDFRSFPDGYVATARDVKAELGRIGHELKPFDIVLVNTSAAAAYGREDYHNSGCGMGRDATNFLTDAGVQVVGTDAWSWDAPFVHTAKRFAQSGDPAIIWEGHKAGRERPYYQMEKLHNLEALPPHGFTVACFPVKIERASAGWVRAVAWVNPE
ncbi:cyclase family protein [Novosphingobium sp. ERN07]|uniref:cyclase family protein n=1 Tax=Novosphingobium sp. ERN07 TaxID=2726187 RepID=UPI0014566F13|nr:cyclase family protein [Novosphingobium sp. ERN07]NLR70315.1 cyclase family protein [Novosphingobium sp. ERN07]